MTSPCCARQTRIAPTGEHPTINPPFENAFATIELSPRHAMILRYRYLLLVHHLQRRACTIATLFHISRTVITVGSLLVPALLSIQSAQATIGLAEPIYWTAWVVSLLVTMCNGLLTLFKLDKRYYYLHTILEQLVSEGWQYIELTGKYSGFHTPGQIATHENQFVFFCHAVERIRMRQIEEEYFRLTEPQQQANPAQAPPAAATAAATTTPNLNALIPPTPLQGQLTDLPPEIQHAIQLLSQFQANGGGEGQAQNPQGNANRPAEPMPVH